MKKTLLLLTLCAILALGCACSNMNTTDLPLQPQGAQESVQNKPVQQQSSKTEPIAADVPNEYDALVQYIRTEGHHDSEYPQTVIIKSRQELYNYYIENKYDYDLWNEWNSTVSFIDAIEKYDETFFEDNALLLVLMQEGSGSNRHRVKDIQKEDDMVTVEVDRLLPEPFTCDMAMWHIIVEQPKDDLEGQSIKVNVNDVPMERPPYEQPEHKITFSSGEETIIPYEVMKWSESYDAETGEGISADYGYVTLDDLTNELPQLTISEDLSVLIADNGQRDKNVVLYDTQFNELGTVHDLSVGVLMQHGPGTYYVSLDVKWVGDYIEATQANNGYGARYFAKLILPEEEYGLAKQLEELSGFDTASLQKTEVYMTANAEDGSIVPVSIDNGEEGLDRLLSLMRSTETQSAELAPAMTGWSQVIRLHDDEKRMVTIKAVKDGLYVSVDGKYYTISAPPWLFEQMVQAIAGCRVMPMEEAITFAWETVKQRKEYELFTDGSETKTTALLKDGYKWIVTYHIEYSNGETKDLSVTIENHHITRIEESD